MSDILKRQQQGVQQVNPAQLESYRRQQQQQQAIDKPVEQQPYNQELAKSNAELAQFESDNVKLDSGEWIARSEFNKLSSADQDKIKSLGIQGFNTYYDNQLKEYQQNYIQLNTGEWVDKTYYNDLPADWQNEIKARGVAGWKQFWDSKPYRGATDFVEGELFGRSVVFGKTSDPNIGIDASGMNVYLGDTWPEHIIRYTGNPDTSPGYKEAQGKPLIPAGVTLPSIFVERDKILAQIKSGELIQTAKGELVNKEVVKQLSPEYQTLLKEKGVEAVNKQYEKDIQYNTADTTISDMQAGQQREFLLNNVKLPDGYMNRDEFMALPKNLQVIANKEGVKGIDISSLPPEKQFEKMKEWGMVGKNDEYGGVDEQGNIILKDGTPWTEKYLNAEMAKGIGVGMIPIAGTLYHWEKSQWWENGISIALDVATFIPFVGAVSAGVRGGKAIGASVGRALLAEVKAPITAIAHPIATTKGAIAPIETLLRPSKIPLTALEIRYSTVRIPVEGIGKATDAMKARDILTTQSIHGQKPMVEIAGKQVEMAKVALQQKTLPAAIHATQDIRPFLEGITIVPGREGGLFVAPTLHSRFTKASAFGDVTEGGVNGAIIIRDEKILSQLQPSGKVYRNTVEIEKLLPGGVDLPPASQILMTRDAGGNKLTLAIIGKPLSQAEITRLKFMGSADVISDIFRPAVKIGGKGTKFDELADIGRDAQKLEKEIEVAKKTKNTTQVQKLEQELKSLNTEGRNRARAIDLDYAARSSLRPIGISTGEFVSRISYRESAARSPERFARQIADMPRADRNRIINDLDRKLSTRITREITRIPVKERVARGRIEIPATRATDIPRTERPPVRITDVPRVGRASTPDGRVPPPIRGIGTPVRKVPPPTGTPPPPIITSQKIEIKKITEEQKKSAIAWKQGFIYKMRYPPWGQEDIINSPEPIPGVKYHEGLGSAVKSAVALRGDIPKALSFDMGIVDTQFFRTSNKAKPRLVFRPDPKQKTKHAGVIKPR